MPANRRGFFHLLLSLPVVGTALGWLSPLRAAAPVARRDVYKEDAKLLAALAQEPPVTFDADDVTTGGRGQMKVALKPAL